MIRRKNILKKKQSSVSWRAVFLVTDLSCMCRKDAGGAVRRGCGVTGTDSWQPSSPSSPSLPSSLLFSPLTSCIRLQGRHLHTLRSPEVKKGRCRLMFHFPPASTSCACFPTVSLSPAPPCSSCIFHVAVSHSECFMCPPQRGSASLGFPGIRMFNKSPLHQGALMDLRSMCKHHLDPHVVSRGREKHNYPILSRKQIIIFLISLDFYLILFVY